MNHSKLKQSHMLTSRIGQYQLDIHAAAQNALRYTREDLDRHQSVHLNVSPVRAMLDDIRAVLDLIEKTVTNH